MSRYTRILPPPLVWPALLVAVLLPLAGCGGSSGSGSGGGGSPAADVSAPYFAGAKSIATAGGAFVLIGWEAAVDEDGAAPTYRVFASATTTGQNFAAPILTTAPGATSALLDSGMSPLIAVGQPVFLVVRAVDASGNEDTNTVELVATPVAAGAVAFVSDTAGGAGTLGDASDPFPTIQAGVAAVEGNGEGAVLVDAAPGGTTYTEEVDLTAAVTNIALYGGFARFSTLPAGPTGAQILGLRDVSARRTTISGLGLLPLSDGDLVRVDNGGSPTSIDGFALRDTDVLTPLTGTLTFMRGSTIVNGSGTSFTGELGGGDLIQLDAHGVSMSIAEVFNDTQLRLESAYPAADGAGAGSMLADTPEVGVRGVDAVLQLSCCWLLANTTLDADTTGMAIESALRIVGNEAVGVGDDAFQVGGGASLLRFQGNTVFLRGSALSDDTSAAGDLFVPTGGLDLYVTHNRLRHNRDAGGSDDVVDLSFSPAMPGAGGALDALIEHNDLRDFQNSAIRLEDVLDVGANGAVSILVRHNHAVGTSTDVVDIEGLGGGDPHPGVDAEIRCEDNQFFDTNSNAFEISLGVSAGRMTRVILQDNLIQNSDSEALNLDDEAGPSDDVSDEGAFEVGIYRNLVPGATDDFDVDMGAPHGGTLSVTCMENTIFATGDPCFRIRVSAPVGTTTVVRPYPVNLNCVNIFNNDLQGGDDECIEWRGDNSTGLDNQTAVIGYIAHNFCRNGSDGSDGAIAIENLGADGVGVLVERNFAGIGGQDSTEAGIEYDASNDDVGNEIHMRNNVVTLGSGGGFNIDARGGFPQIVNNTAAYGGQPFGQFGFENDSGPNDGDHQSLVLNCIAAFNGGGDIDRRGGFSAFYSLVRDENSVFELGNLNGDPFFAEDLENFTGFPLIPGDVLGTIFSVQPTSPTVDAGHPDARYNDPDGSRNDMGAYGGPGAGPLGPVAAGTPVPFQFVATYPSVHLYSGRVLAPDGDPIHLGFSTEVDPATLAAGISITNDGVPVPGTLDLLPGSKGRLVRFTPTGSLTPGASPLVVVSMNTSLLDTDGTPLKYPWTFSFGTRPAAPAAESEPNDDTVPGLLPADFAAAQALGAGPGEGVFEVDATIANADDVDVYSFQASAGDRIMATTLDRRIGGGNDGTIHLNLYDASMNLLKVGRRNSWNDDNAAANGDTYVDYMLSAGGTYYLVVTNPDTAAPPQTYRLMGVLD